VERVLPGRSPTVIELREKVFQFCANPSARAVLLRGPVGSGKSSVARLLGFGKRIAPLRPEEAQRRIDVVRFDGPGRIDLRSMSWYVELTVTGLIDSLASAQLFGIKEKTATGVAGGPGVFERAAKGLAGDPGSGAAVTGGVVFLDELADLSPELQAKLLPVFANGRYYHVGGEGDRKFEREFDGVIVTATWADPRRTVRSDLLSRIAGTVIDVPSLSARIEDLSDIVESIRSSAVDRYRNRLRNIIRQDPDVDRGFYEAQADLGRLPESSREILAQTEWSKFGELRGLTNVIERTVLGGEELTAVLRSLQPIETPEATSEALGLYDALLRDRSPGGGLAGRVKGIEKRQRAELREELLANRGELQRLAKAFGVDERALVAQVRELDRTRRTNRGDR
jgi:DNA-binding NtrC family response regulator